jgi:ketosteroid isomerase-like protein
MNPLILAAGALLMGSVAASASDLETLTQLNQSYIRSVEKSDAAWFDRNLGQDFLCTNPDGSQVDRGQFLKQVAERASVPNLGLHDVNVRVLGDFAIIHAGNTYILPGGQSVSTRYTDIWAKREGRWVAISAQITRVAQ